MREDTIKGFKNQVQLKAKSEQLNVLQDIVDKLNKKNYKEFINSDLSYFLCKILVYRQRASTSLVLRIICNLSETKEFYRHEFFCYTKFCLRLINSFPKHSFDGDQDEILYKRSILSTNTIMLRRAKVYNVNFNDERIPKLSHIIIASTLTILNSTILEKLEFVNAVLDVLYLMEVSSNDKTYVEKKLLEILGNLRFNSSDLQHDDYFILLASLLQNIIKLLSKSRNSSQEQLLIIQSVMQKFFAVMKFILLDNQSTNYGIYEVFISLFYFVLKSPALSSIKYILLNRFLSLDGLSFLVFIANSNENSTSDRQIVFKSRVTIAEIMVHILKIFHGSVDSDEIFDILRTKYLKICFKCNFNPQNVFVTEMSQLSPETLMFAVFRYYILLKWNRLKKTRGEMLSSMAFIMEVFKCRNIAMDSGILSMVFYIYTTNFSYVSIKGNSLLERSSLTLLKYIDKVNVIIDFNFFKWWLLHNWKNSEKYKALIGFLISKKSYEDFSLLTEDDLSAIDLKYLLSILQDKKTPIENIEKLTEIICCCKINLRDYDKLLNLYEKQRTIQDRRLSLSMLRILCVNFERLNLRLRIKTCDIVSKTLKASTNLQERLLSIQLFLSLI